MIFSLYRPHSLPLITLPNLHRSRTEITASAQLIVKRLNRLNDEKSSRIIIKTRLADDR